MNELTKKYETIHDLKEKIAEVRRLKSDSEGKLPHFYICFS